MQLADRRERRDDRGRAGHVGLHVVHVVGWFDRDPAGIEGDPLPHQGEVVPVTTAALVPHHDELGRLVASLRDGEIAPHPEGLAALAVEHLDTYAGVLRELLGGLGDEPRRHTVRGLVRETAGGVRRFADRLAARDRVADGLLRDERDRVDRRKTLFFVARAMDLGSPHRVDRALDRGLGGALFADRAGGCDSKRDFAHRRSPEGTDPRARDVPRPLRVQLRGLAGADEHDARLAVVRRHAVKPCRAVLGLLDARERVSRRTRKPRRQRSLGEDRDHDRIDVADRGGTDGAELHRATSFRRVSVAMRRAACSGVMTSTRSSPVLRVMP